MAIGTVADEMRGLASHRHWAGVHELEIEGTGESGLEQPFRLVEGEQDEPLRPAPPPDAAIDIAAEKLSQFNKLVH